MSLVPQPSDEKVYSFLLSRLQLYCTRCTPESINAVCTEAVDQSVITYSLHCSKPGRRIRCMRHAVLNICTAPSNARRSRANAIPKPNILAN
jgi:hypothetical protein